MEFLKNNLMGGLVIILTIFVFQACSDDDGPTTPEGSGNIVEVGQSNDDFSTLVSAVTDAGLADDLQAEGEVMINDNASVVTADVEASNGVIHAIDQVVSLDS